MNSIDFKDSAKSINFAHLYFNYTELTNLESYSKLFRNFYPIDMADLPKKLPQIDILFIEVPTISKEKFIIINSIVKQYASKCIYIFAKDTENSFLLKFALHFSLNKVLPIENDTRTLEKTIQNAITKYIHKETDKQHVEISKRLNTFFAILVFKDNKLVFVNDKTKEIFDLNNLNAIESIIKNDEMLYSLLLSKENDNKVIVMKNSLGEDWKYNFFLNVLPNGKDKLLSVIPHRKIEEEELNFATLNRFKFIELLKDKLAQSSVYMSEMSLILINVSNYEKITKAAGSIKVHDFIKKFIMKIIGYKEPYQELTQWNPHFFIILVEGESFESVKEKLDSMHQKLIYTDFDETIHPVITSSVLELDTDDINTIISHVENISERKFDVSQLLNNNFFEINHLNDYLSEEEQITHYFHSCIANKTQLKFLNIYKGLCINTHTKAIKMDDGSYFFTFETLQGYSMQLEQKTVIQSPDLPNDISADVAFVNFEKSIVVLNNFHFMKTSANSRQNTRVQPSIRTPLMLRYEKFSYQGEILDMSITAIAANFFQKISEKLLNHKVLINFKLIDSGHDDGFVEVKVYAKVTYISDFDKVTKVVFILEELEKPFDSYMLKYMYVRQKELILELKKAVKVKSKAVIV